MIDSKGFAILETIILIPVLVIMILFFLKGFNYLLVSEELKFSIFFSLKEVVLKSNTLGLKKVSILDLKKILQKNLGRKSKNLKLNITENSKSSFSVNFYYEEGALYGWAWSRSLKFQR